MCQRLVVRHGAHDLAFGIDEKEIREEVGGNLVLGDADIGGLRVQLRLPAVA